MRSLTLKCDGHEVHIPYELPDSLRFDCFVPGSGLCEAYVDVRSDKIDVIEVRQHLPVNRMASATLTDGAEYMPAVLEQAGDVCAVFERALDLTRVDRISDATTLSTIARIAVLESDLHTEWCRLPAIVSPPEPCESNERHSLAARSLKNFVADVLVPRAQDMATAAAKKRMTQWEENQREMKAEALEARRWDAAIKRAKEEV